MILLYLNTSVLVNGKHSNTYSSCYGFPFVTLLWLPLCILYMPPTSLYSVYAALIQSPNCATLKLYADEPEMYKSICLNETASTIQSAEQAVSDAKSW